MANMDGYSYSKLISRSEVEQHALVVAEEGVKCNVAVMPMGLPWGSRQYRVHLQYTDSNLGGYFPESQRRGLDTRVLGRSCQ